MANVKISELPDLPPELSHFMVLADGEDALTGKATISDVLALMDLSAITGNQLARRVFAGPTSGGAAAPAFRLLAAADIPDLSEVYQSFSAELFEISQIEDNNVLIFRVADGDWVGLTIGDGLDVTDGVLSADGGGGSSAWGDITGKPAPVTALGALANASGFLKNNGSGTLTWDSPTGSGDVVGPASGTDNALARFDSTTGKLIQNSVATLSDTGELVAKELRALNTTSFARVFIESQNDTSNAAFQLITRDNTSSTRQGGVFFTPANGSDDLSFLSLSGDATDYHLLVYGDGRIQVNTSLPLYLSGNWPGFGLNAYYDGAWKYGAGSSSNYAAYTQLDPTNGNFFMAMSPVAGNANGAITPNICLLVNKDGRMFIGQNSVGIIGVDPALGQLNLKSATASTDGIAFGSDTNLYRSAAGTLSTDGILITIKDGVGQITRTTSTTGYASFRAYNDQNTGLRALEMGYTGSAFSGSVLPNGPTGECAYISSTGNYPLSFGVDNTFRMGVGTHGGLTIQNRSSVPPTPTDGGTFYIESGALKYIGSGGTITTLAPA